MLALIVNFALVLSVATAASAEWRTSFGPTSSLGVELLGVSPEGTPLVGSNAGCSPEDPRAVDAPQIALLSPLDGDVLWTLTQEDSHPYDLVDCGWWQPLVDREGNIYVAGYPKGEWPGAGFDSSGWFLVSYSRDGSFRWASPIDGLELDAYEGVTAEAIGADGNIYIYVDGHLHGYRASDGTSLWDVAVPAQNQGFGLYADASGLTVGGTIRFSYSGQLIHPEPANGVVREASIAQEPGGAVYTVTADHSKCAARKPYIGIRVTRWTLSGIDWVKTLKPPNPAASEEECNIYSHEFAVRAVPGGGVVVAASNRYQTPVEEILLFDLDTKGHVRWTHETARGWSDYQSFSSIRVTSDGEIVTLEHGREPCTLNIYSECGAVAVNFINAGTGQAARPSVLLHNSIQPYESAVYEPMPQGESLGVGPGAVYLSLEIDGEHQIVQLSAPGLGADYAEALRAENNGGSPNVKKVSPSRGLWGGGTSVTIKGANFTGTTAVHFGSAASPEFSVTSTTSITAIAPRGPSGNVAVTVTTPAGTSETTRHDQFLYEPAAEYVALGDSFASGLGSFSYLSGTTTGSHPCYQATDGYVEQLAGLSHDTLAFVACQGSSIGSLLEGPAPQLNQLSSSTGLVTLSIGGIDVGFPQVIASCVEGWKSKGGYGCAQRDEPLATQALEWLEHGRPPNTYTLPGIDEKTGQPDTSTNTIPLPSLEELYERIASLAPNARIFVVGYPLLFESGYTQAGDCEVAPTYEVSGDDIQWLDRSADALDGIIDTAASSAALHSNRPIVYVDPRPEFTYHGLCDTDTSYLNGLSINTKKWPPTKWEPNLESFHPNVAGQNALFSALDAAGAG